VPGDCAQGRAVRAARSTALHELRIMVLPQPFSGCRLAFLRARSGYGLMQKTVCGRRPWRWRLHSGRHADC
jgi:hypothetical protein